MDKSNTGDRVQPPIGEEQQSYNSVFGFSSRNEYDDKLNDDKYADLIDNYQFDINVNNVVHNVYIDHLDHGADSKYHHHHLATEDRHNDHLDIIHHKHDGAVGHDHHIVHYDDEYDSHKHYGPGNHDHSDDGATEHGTT